MSDWNFLKWFAKYFRGPQGPPGPPGPQGESGTVGTASTVGTSAAPESLKSDEYVTEIKGMRPIDTISAHDLIDIARKDRERIARKVGAELEPFYAGGFNAVFVSIDVNVKLGYHVFKAEYVRGEDVLHKWRKMNPRWRAFIQYIEPKLWEDESIMKMQICGHPPTL